MGKCSFCGKDLVDGYQLVAIDGVHIAGEVTSLEPIFTKDSRRLYKNYFVHRSCVENLTKYLIEKLEENQQ